jgi:uncharacterized membrane protein
VIDGPTERNPARVVAFSDAVIAIAITLLILEIRPPEDTRHLIAGLAALWPSYVSYVTTFLLIGQVWVDPRTSPAGERARSTTAAILTRTSSNAPP